MLKRKKAQGPKTVINPNISMSYDEIAKVMNITTQEVKDLEQTALEKIRHPRVGYKLKKYLGL